MSSGNGTIFPTPAQSAAQLKIEAATAETAATKRHATFVAEQEASNQALSSHLRAEYVPPAEIRENKPVQQSLTAAVLAFQAVGYTPTGATMDQIGVYVDMLSMSRENIIARLALIAARPECHAAITKTRITVRAAELILAGMILAA